MPFIGLSADMGVQFPSQFVSAAAAAPVYVVEKMMKKNITPDNGKPPGMRKQIVTASAVSFTVRPMAACPHERPPSGGTSYRRNPC